MNLTDLTLLPSDVFSKLKCDCWYCELNRKMYLRMDEYMHQQYFDDKIYEPLNVFKTEPQPIVCTTT